MKATAREQIKDEMSELANRYGRASMTLAEQYFHCSRAKQTLDFVLLANPRRSDDEVLHRLVHLAAVCQRLAMALNGEDTA